jgi:hypothetical protein
MAVVPNWRLFDRDLLLDLDLHVFDPQQVVPLSAMDFDDLTHREHFVDLDQPGCFSSTCVNEQLHDFSLAIAVSTINRSR